MASSVTRLAKGLTIRTARFTTSEHATRLDPGARRLRGQARSGKGSAGRQIVPGTGAVPRTGGGVVAPEALNGVLLPVVAGDVVEPARNGRRARGAERVTDPRALVAVLLGAVVVPSAEVLAVDHVFGTGIGDRLFDLVAQHDCEAVEPAGVVAGVDRVLPTALTHVEAVGHVRERD